MESKATILFSEQEKIFRERTGKDFSTLYQKYYPKLIYFTSKMCNDTQKAEDISTDSFLVAFEKIEKYEKEKSQFSTWLFTIAKNLALQKIKTDKKTMSLDVEFDEDGTTMKDFIQDTISDDYLHEIYDKKAEIMKTHIRKLKDPYKSVIEMRELKRMSYKDITDQFLKNKNNGKIYLKMNDGVVPIGHKESISKFEGVDFTPISLSTIKSQIRNARAILMKETSKAFEEIDEMYL